MQKSVCHRNRAKEILSTPGALTNSEKILHAYQHCERAFSFGEPTDAEQLKREKYCKTVLKSLTTYFHDQAQRLGKHFEALNYINEHDNQCLTLLVGKKHIQFFIREHELHRLAVVLGWELFPKNIIKIEDVGTYVQSRVQHLRNKPPKTLYWTEELKSIGNNQQFFAWVLQYKTKYPERLTMYNQLVQRIMNQGKSSRFRPALAQVLAQVPQACRKSTWAELHPGDLKLHPELHWEQMKERFVEWPSVLGMQVVVRLGMFVTELTQGRCNVSTMAVEENDKESVLTQKTVKRLDMNDLLNDIKNDIKDDRKSRNPNEINKLVSDFYLERGSFSGMDPDSHTSFEKYLVKYLNGKNIFLKSIITGLGIQFELELSSFISNQLIKLQKQRYAKEMRMNEIQAAKEDFKNDPREQELVLNAIRWSDADKNVLDELERFYEKVVNDYNQQFGRMALLKVRKVYDEWTQKGRAYLVSFFSKNDLSCIDRCEKHDTMAAHISWM